MIKKRAFWAVKKLCNRFGFDIKQFHPHYTTVLKTYGIRTIFDIGANNGQFALDARAHLPDAHIYSFEPLKDCYTELVKNMVDAPHFKAFNFGLGAKNTESDIHRSTFSPSSSLLPMAQLHKELYPKSIGTVDEKITIKRLDDIFDGLAVEKPLMIKMDVQGYEDQVISGGIKTLSQASVLLIETSFKVLYEGQPLFEDICDLVRPLGFVYYGNNGQHWNKKTQELIYEDSIFVKKI